MAKVEIEVYTRKHGEWSTTVPDEIIEKGDQAIRDYLWKCGAVDQAIDYGSGDTEVNYLVTDNE